MQTTLSYTLLALSTLTQAQQGLPVSGPGKAGYARSRDGLLTLDAAGRSPNATSAITFNRKYDGEDEEWTWRVNITEVAVPNRVLELGDDDADDSEGYLVANTQWQLDWPGDETDSLQGVAEMRDAKIFFTTLHTNKATDVLDEYSDDDDGDCTSLLGEECLESLTEAASQSKSVVFSGLSGCGDTLNTNDGGGDDGASFTIVKPDPEADVNERWRREGTIFYRTSGLYTADDTATFDRALSAVQVFIMNFAYDSDELGESSGPTILCRVVDDSVHADPVESEEVEEGEDNDENNNNEEEDDGGNAAVTLGKPMTAIWVLMTMSLAILM